MRADICRSFFSILCTILQRNLVPSFFARSYIILKRMICIYPLALWEYLKISASVLEQICERMRCVMHMRSDGKKFRAIEENNFREILLDFLCRAGEYS